MPYQDHTAVFVSIVIKIWKLYYLNYHTQYKLTQLELTELISKYYKVKVSVRTIKAWINNERNQRGQGIGVKRGGYDKQIE
jgi:hypothetical protein